MISDDPILEEFLNQHGLWAIYTVVIGGVLYAGYAVNKCKKHTGSAMRLPD